MYAALSKSSFFGQPMNHEDAKNFEVKLQASNVIEGMTELIDEGIVEFNDTFEIDDDDFVRWGSARQLVLHNVAVYLLQRPLAANEVISEHHLDGRKASKYFQRETYTPFVDPQPATKVDNNAELELLRRENARLKLENERLRCEKELAEEQAIAAMRRRPSHRAARSYATLDELVSDMLTNAVADGIRQAVSPSASENFIRSLAAIQTDEVSHV